MTDDEARIEGIAAWDDAAGQAVVWGQILWAIPREVRAHEDRRCAALYERLENERALYPGQPEEAAARAALHARAPVRADLVESKHGPRRGLVAEIARGAWDNCASVRFSVDERGQIQVQYAGVPSEGRLPGVILPRRRFGETREMVIALVRRAIRLVDP